MKEVGRLIKDIFWASMMVLVLLAIAFFTLRVVARLGNGTIVSRGASGLAHLATPQG